MPAIVWDETLPSDGSNANTADNEFRSMMSNIATGLGASFFWPGSAASQGASTTSTGEMRIGSARALTPITTGAGGWGGMPDGFLAMPIDINGLYHNGSTWTGQLSHSAMLEHAGGIGSAPFTKRWLVQTGVINSSNGSETITFTTAYDGIPHITIGPGTSGRDVHYGIRNESTTGFILDRVDKSGGGLASSRFWWMSEGTASF